MARTPIMKGARVPCNLGTVAANRVVTPMVTGDMPVAFSPITPPMVPGSMVALHTVGPLGDYTRALYLDGMEDINDVSLDGNGDVLYNNISEMGDFHAVFHGAGILLKNGFLGKDLVFTPRANFTATTLSQYDSAYNGITLTYQALGDAFGMTIPGVGARAVALGMAYFPINDGNDIMFRDNEHLITPSSYSMAVRSSAYFDSLADVTSRTSEYGLLIVGLPNTEPVAYATALGKRTRLLTNNQVRTLMRASENALTSNPTNNIVEVRDSLFYGRTQVIRGDQLFCKIFYNCLLCRHSGTGYWQLFAPSHGCQPYGVAVL